MEIQQDPIGELKTRPPELSSSPVLRQRSKNTYTHPLGNLRVSALVASAQASPCAPEFKDGSPTSSQLPADHQDFMNSTGGTLVFQPAETDARHAARVICRQLGFSHLERVYRVAFKISTKTKRNLISAAASPPPLPPLLSTNRASGGPGSATKTGIPTILKWRGGSMPMG
ncbi:uncharacterized protein LOC119589625 [Penaeus monodon]|uniref:uncharacterized protein LOC119589625 n=1 Tax=Penaeus monodon TaxID=6687 RepID=UPI0018A6E15C|nr:uncharacterized protein LOC119589625 [Penaeus monodon]